MGNLNQTFAVRLPRRDKSLTSGTLFLRLSIIMLPCRQRCSSYLSLSPCCLTHPLELDSFSSFLVPAPSDVVGVSDCGLRSSRLLFHPVLGSLVVLTGEPHYGCLSILHGPTASIYAVTRHWLLLWVASFLFDAGYSYFSVANLTQAATGKYWSQAPYSFPNYTAAFRIFFLTPGGG